MAGIKNNEVKLGTLKGMSIRVTLTRSLTIRMWIAIQLHKLAARIVGTDIHIQADD